jgi:hypothetical protein
MKSTIQHPILGSMEVSWNYTPAEKGGLEYPGCPEEYEIYKIVMNGQEASEMLSETALEEIEELIKEERLDRQ